MSPYPEPCLKGRCYSPTACSGFGYCRERNFTEYRHMITAKAAEAAKATEAQRRQPKNLRIESEPYLHLRDDEGCVLASDYINDQKMAFVLEAVREKLARES